MRIRSSKWNFIALSLVTALAVTSCGAEPINGVEENSMYVSDDEKRVVEIQDEYEKEKILIDSIKPKETVTLTVYSELADCGQCVQTGWFAKVLLDKFNVKLRYTYNGKPETTKLMIKSGKTSDLMIWDSDEGNYSEAIRYGLLLPWDENNLLKTYGFYIYDNMKSAMTNNKTKSYGRLYGIGSNVASRRGQIADFEYHPDIRWDLYEKIGKPPVSFLEDYIDVLKKMKEICPTSDSGRETYGVSLFSNWDDNLCMIVAETCAAFFGQDEFGIGLYSPDTGGFQGALATNGYYLRALSFYHDLYVNHLLNPLSRSQKYEDARKDYMDGAAFFSVMNRIGATEYNTFSHSIDGKMMLPLVAKRQETLIRGLSHRGDNVVWTISAKSKHRDLAMSIINWLYTPEGRLTYQYGPKGVCWDFDLNKTPYLMEAGYKATHGDGYYFIEDSKYPGSFEDGKPKINASTWSIYTTIPNSNNILFDSETWPNVLAKDDYELEAIWKEENGANSFREYMMNHNFVVDVPSNYTQKQKSEELQEKWDAVTKIIVKGSWDAIYAPTEVEYQRIVEDMREKANEAGYEECVQWCREEAFRKKLLEKEYGERSSFAVD